MTSDRGDLRRRLSELIQQIDHELTALHCGDGDDGGCEACRAKEMLRELDALLSSEARFQLGQEWVAKVMQSDADDEPAVMGAGVLPAPVVAHDALDVLPFAAGAIIDAICEEDGLDGLAGERVLGMINAVLVAHGREPVKSPLPEQAPRGWQPMRDLLEELRQEHRQCLVNAGVDNRCLRCYRIDGLLADAPQKG